MAIRQSVPTFMQPSAGQTGAPNPPPFLRFLVSCLISKHFDPVEKVLHEHFPTRSHTLAKYLSLTSSDFDIKPPPPPHDATCISSHRLGLNMSQEKFRMAKSLLSQYYIVSGCLKGVLHLKLSPYVVMYAAMDLDVPLPDDFDKWFLWRHIEQLLQLRRTADLVVDDDILPPVLSGPTIPLEYMVDVTEDPDGVLQRLYCSHHHTQTFHSSSFPEPKRPLSELPSIQVTLATTDRGTAGEMCSWNGGMVSHHWFGLRRQPSDLAFVSSREAYALLDATCCWGLSWRGRTVLVNLPNQRLVWALNDFIDASAEFPVVEVLLTLADRCGFEFTAIYTYSPLHHPSVDRHAQGQYNRFSEGSGLALPLMDVVLFDVPFAKGDLFDLEDVVLSTYRAILVGCGSRGYTGGLYNPGSLYSEMRSRQAFVVVEDDAHTWYTSPKRRPLEDPITHLSPPDWKRVLERRLGETPDVLHGNTASANCIPGPLHGTLVATRVRDPPLAPIFHVRCTPEEKLETQKRRTRKVVQARESAMRLRAAGDDAACVATNMPTFDRWSGSCSN